MTDERDDLLKAIGEALDIEPSPGFATRVSATAEATSHGAAWTRWIWIASAGVTAMLAVLVLRPSPKPAGVPASAPAPTVATNSEPRPVAPVVPAAPVASARVRELSRPANLHRAPAPSMAPIAPIATQAGNRPDMQVVTNQGDVLGRVWASARPAANTPVDARSLESAFATLGDLTPMAIDDIPVEPIVVSSIESSSPPSAGPGGTIRRVVEAESARSEK